MSLNRLATPLFPTANIAFRPSLLSSNRCTQLCSTCLRQISPRQSRSRLPRQRSTSSTAPKRQHLEPTQPPRNAGIPDTSIAGGKPGVDFDWKQHPSSVAPNSPLERQAGNSSLTEGEAQQPKPVKESAGGEAVGGMANPAASAQSSSQAQSPRKSKLRPRKAAMTLSPAAVEQLQEMLNQPDPKLIRVGVKNRGCSGLAYHLEYVDKPGSFDETVEQDGVKVLVDSKALFSIIGSEMDWVEDKLSRRFIFKNPNITEQCGCGESFSIG